ncbi:MAG: indole-3-glycerol phosphate synthase TrpC [Janthinobacterium lividum]
MTNIAAPSSAQYLPQILDSVRGVVEMRKRTADFRALEQQAAEHTPRGFARALRAKASSGPAIIAELKKASPSKGLIRPDFEVTALACQLEDGGATVLSVLTEDRFFQGSLENLRLASAAVSIPCLRKDFTVDPFQVLEARANGADAILLIVAALTDRELRTLREEARRCELDVLCEVHDREELDRALSLDCECIGVNSRDLRTFQVSLERACDLAQFLPSHAVRVAESGINGRADIDRLWSGGFEAFLIGELLMRQRDPGEALRALLEEAGGHS